MTQSFTCPNCSAPLDYEGDDPTLRCPYCNSSVIVPDSLRSPGPGPTGSPLAGSGTPWVGGALLSPMMRLREVAENIRSGNKVEAVRIYRETFSVGLSEAREAVESLAAGRPVLMPGSTMIGEPSIDAPSNPAITTSFTPQTVATSSRGATYTLKAGPQTSTSFIVHWIRLSLVGLVAAPLLTLAAIPFPNLIRLAAPAWCPANYTDAFGILATSYDSSDDSTNYSVSLHCVDAEGATGMPNGVLAWATLFALFLGAGILVAMGLAALLRFGPAGCLPLGAILLILPLAFFAYASLIPAGPGGNAILRLFETRSGGAPSLPDLSFLAQVEPTATGVPAVTGTPSLASAVISFGSGEGAGPGFFNDTRMLAVDGAGSIFTADYSGGRIQVFNSAGQFVNQWQVEGDTVYITGLTASRQGVLYVVFGGNIYQYEGTTGTFRGKVNYDVSYVQVAAMSAAGDLVAVSRQAIVRFDADGQQTLDVEAWEQKAGVSGADADDVALDGAGNIYLVDSGANAIYKFSAGGEFMETLGTAGKEPGQLDFPRAAAFDGQGRLYVVDYKGIQVFDPGGAYLGLIPVEGLGFDMVVNDQGDLVFMDRNANKVVIYKVP